jgi:hypothetical protein
MDRLLPQAAPRPKNDFLNMRKSAMAEIDHWSSNSSERSFRVVFGRHSPCQVFSFCIVGILQIPLTGTDLNIASFSVCC